MMAEFLRHCGSWTSLMPGVNACQFAMEEGGCPCILPLHMERLHFEALFCLGGQVKLTRKDGSVLIAGMRQVLLITDVSGLSEAMIDAQLEGVLVEVDAGNARDSLKILCTLLGDLSVDTKKVKSLMDDCGGCKVEGPTERSQALFSDLEHLPKSEQARWCVWKSVELLYLFSSPAVSIRELSKPGRLDKAVARRLEETRRYMEGHLDEHLTIAALSRMTALSDTSFKTGFRLLYGMPVHRWLRQRRMELAAKLLRDSPLSVLGVAQEVGYGSVSQFTAAFRKHYGVTPAMYRKMSDPA